MTKSNDAYDNVLIKNIYLNKNKKYIVETNLDADEEFKIDEDIIVKYGILKGKEFTLKEFKKILKDIDLQKLFNKCVNYLSYKARSKHEVYAYLDKQNVDKKYKQEDFIKIVSRLKDYCYIDDTKYAKTIFDYYKKTKGKNYIINYLKEKRVDEDIIENVLSGYERCDEEASAYEKACKFIPQYRKYPLNKQRELLYRKLLSNGFDMDISTSVIKRLDFIDESSETLKRDIAKKIKSLEGKNLSSYEKKNKLLAFMLNKGYNINQINEQIKKLF